MFRIPPTEYSLVFLTRPAVYECTTILHPSFDTVFAPVIKAAQIQFFSPPFFLTFFQSDCISNRLA